MERYRRGPKGPDRQHSPAFSGSDADGSTEDPKTSDADHAVGYGKPPKRSQFKPGKSGNPKGRPKGSRNFQTDVKSTLEAPVKVMRNGKPRSVSTQAAALLRLREKALGGDPRALDSLIRLAQVYNDEGSTAGSEVTANDGTLLAIYGARLLSGAAEISAKGIRGDADVRPGIPSKLREDSEDTRSKKARAQAPDNQVNKVDPGRRK